MKFLTKNKHKFNEVHAVMSEFGISIEQLAEEKIEDKEKSNEFVAKYNAELFYKKTGKPIMVDDTGIFFDAYPMFPGANAKLIFNLIGYKGLLKLVEGMNRGAVFRSVAAFCDADGVKSFIGELRCVIGDKVYGKEVDVLPYERILLIDDKPLAFFTREEKNKISHRAIAFRKLGEFLRSR